jgi:hypothetical protein
VVFEKSAPSITAVFGDKSTSFKIESDEENAYATLGSERITPDEISQKILEPVLFPVETKSRPTSKPTRRPGGKRYRGCLESLSPEEIQRIAGSLLGKKYGSKGGKNRAKKLTSKRRSEIAQKAAEARWKKPKNTDAKE